MEDCMAGIWNINSAYHINSKRVVSKLSFDLGQIFQARIVGFEEAKQEILLKMLDGWQFAAKLTKPLEFLPEGLIKFQVEGFEDGKLQLHILPKLSQEETKHDSIGDMLEEQHILLGEEDNALLEKMIQHRLPLTKENITSVKTMVDLRHRLLYNDNEEGKFIKNYMESKGLNPEEPRGQNAEVKLQGFFNVLKISSIDDLLTLYENGIDINEENLKSLHKISNGTQTIYKEIQELAGDELLDDLNSQQELAGNEQLDDSTGQQGLKSNTRVLDVNNENGILIRVSKENVNQKPSTENFFHQGGDGGQDAADVIRKQADVLQVVDKPVSKGERKNTENINQLEIDIGVKEAEKQPLENKLVKLSEETVNEIKTQIRARIEETKINIKAVLVGMAGDNTEVAHAIFEGLGEKVNDFKVYNTLSSQYYYLDVPLEIRNRTYGCKLIIRDERKKGKRIDSKNVSFVASVKTVNIGIVDAYIRIRNSNMNVELYSDEKWLSLLYLGAETISRKLEQLGYNPLVKVKEKEREVTLSNCGEFFQDTGLASINVKV